PSPTCKLLKAALVQSRLSKRRAYHCDDHPGGGKVRKREEVSESGTMISVGAARNSIAKPATSQSQNLPPANRRRRATVVMAAPRTKSRTAPGTGPSVRE